MYGRDSRQSNSAGLGIADDYHALGLPELHSVHSKPSGRRHSELHSTSRRLVARLLHHAAVAAALVPELCGKLMDCRDTGPGRDVSRKRREVHGLYLKPTFSRLRALVIRQRQQKARPGATQPPPFCLTPVSHF